MEQRGALAFEPPRHADRVLLVLGGASRVALREADHTALAEIDRRDHDHDATTLMIGGSARR